ncbi:unnamed protein product [Prorocentrum cordatum]|uniref:Uncharacterized protein n=1 Tax=Prorocentrum cordatum TaxID=2364126 RepID=A0ABN9PH93_9DINO|nr:unnamed protein product [Polarella glacialis]
MELVQVRFSTPSASRVQRLIDAMGSVITKPNFLARGTKERKSPLRRPEIERQAKLIKNIAMVVPSPTIAKSDLIAVLGMLQNGRPFDLTGQELEEWQEEAAPRLRTILRHVQQMRIKKDKAPQWFRYLDVPPLAAGGADGDDGGEPDGGDAAADGEEDCPPDDEGNDKEGGEEEPREVDEEVDADDEAAKSAQKTPVAADYTHGYDNAHKLARRLPAGRTGAAHREYAVEMVPPPKHTSSSTMLAVFADGVKRQVPETTVSTFCASMRDAKTGPKHGHDTFSGTDQNGKKVTGGFRWDTPKGRPRQRFCTIKVDGETQFTQINVETFASADSPLNEKEAAAVSWMHIIAQKYCNGEITKQEAAELKADYIGIRTAEALCKKRPAAAAADTVPVLKKPVAAAAVGSTAVVAAGPTDAAPSGGASSAPAAPAPTVQQADAAPAPQQDMTVWSESE